jgi:hypothetical protein
MITGGIQSPRGRESGCRHSGDRKGYAVLTISALIREAKNRSGISFRAMAEKAVQAGYRVSHQYLQELAASGPKEWPRHAGTIKGDAIAALVWNLTKELTTTSTGGDEPLPRD